MSHAWPCFLFDNGSLRPAATFSLRKVAAALEEKLGVPVKPVSLLHSSGIDAGKLDGVPAELLEPALVKACSEGLQHAILLPLFFGASAALTEYVPERLADLRRKFSMVEVRLARWLVDVNDTEDLRVAQALCARVVEVIGTMPPSAPPHVVLVDHGTPQPVVTEVRNHLGRQLARLLAHRVGGVHVASMERRAGDQYAFNEPLLEHRLRTPPCDAGDVIVALQFLSAGRHAGPGGDIATICASAEAERPTLRTRMTEPLGADPRIIDVLADRYRQTLPAVNG